jgi:hypothetical protein
LGDDHVERHVERALAERIRRDVEQMGADAIAAISAGVAR